MATVLAATAWASIAAPAAAQETTTTTLAASATTTTVTPTTTVTTTTSVPGTTVPPTTTIAPEPSATIDIEITGHGWGHGRGMGQYGALGYAIDHGWSSAQILDHYYGNTVAGASPVSDITVRLLSRDNAPLTVYLPDGRLATSAAETESWSASSQQAVRITLLGNGTYEIADGPGCAGPFTTRGTVNTAWVRVASANAGSGPIVIRDPASPTDSDKLQLCTGDDTATLYRGELRAAKFGLEQRAVNALPLEQYLRSVVPRESPASWADLGGGAGMAALEAQSVAARSYSLAEDRYDYAKTCDTTSCQVYSGRASRSGSTITVREDARTDTAIANTASLVRLRDGVVQRTEFSSSTGGYTAGGLFPAVPDVGDAVSSNPNHDWSRTITTTDIENKYGHIGLSRVVVTERNGLGTDGGRVKTVELHFGDTVVTRSGNQFRLDWGLKSDWFSVGFNAADHEYPFTESGPVTIVLGLDDAANFELLRAAEELELSPETFQITGVWVGGFLLAIAPEGYVQEPVLPKPPVDGPNRWVVTWDSEQREALDVMSPAWHLSPEETQYAGTVLLIFLAALARAGL